VRWEDAEVAEDAGVAQARMLVGLLHRLPDPHLTHPVRLFHIAHHDAE
jgi:hypothetical protein